MKPVKIVRSFPDFSLHGLGHEKFFKHFLQIRNYNKKPEQKDKKTARITFFFNKARIKLSSLFIYAKKLNGLLYDVHFVTKYM